MKHYRQAIKDLKVFQDGTKREVTKRETAQAKAQAARGEVTVTVTAPTQKTNIGDEVRALLKTDASHSTKSSGVGSSVRKNILNETDVTKSTVVHVPKEELGTVVKTLSNMPYYKEQKGWADKLMEKENLQIASIAIMKVHAARAIQKAIQPISTNIAVETPAQKELEDMFKPQLFQCNGGSDKATCSTDYGLCEARIVLEGSVYILGIAHPFLKGKTLAEKFDNFTSLDRHSAMRNAKEHGFCLMVEAGSMVVLPGGTHCVLMMNGSDVGTAHGLRWQFSGSATTKRITKQYLGELIEDYADMDANHTMLYDLLKTTTS
jgi:hypothetical protein